MKQTPKILKNLENQLSWFRSSTYLRTGHNNAQPHPMHPHTHTWPNPNPWPFLCPNFVLQIVEQSCYTTIELAAGLMSNVFTST